VGFVLVQPPGEIEEGRAIDPELRWSIQEAGDRARFRRRSVDPFLAILGCTYYQEQVVMTYRGEAAKFWRALPEIMVVLDPLEKGVTKESAEWRGKIARANSWRWVAFPKGAVLKESELLEAAGRS
jgi:hypothetical protein